MKCSDAQRLESDWTKNVKFHKNYDDYQDMVFDMLSESKDV